MSLKKKKVGGQEPFKISCISLGTSFTEEKVQVALFRDEAPRLDGFTKAF